VNTAAKSGIGGLWSALSNAVPGDLKGQLESLKVLMDRIGELQENAFRIQGNGLEDINLRRAMLESVLGMLDQAERKVHAISATLPKIKDLIPVLIDWRRVIQDADLKNIEPLKTAWGNFTARLIDGFLKPVMSAAEGVQKQAAKDAERLRDGLGGLPAWFEKAAIAVGAVLVLIFVILIVQIARGK